MAEAFSASLTPCPAPLGSLLGGGEEAVAGPLKAMSTQVQPKYLTLPDARIYCGLSERTLKRAIHAGKVRSFNRGRRLIDRESLDAWIEGKPAS